MDDRTCLTCDADISGSHASRRYCSQSCKSVAAYAARPRVPCSVCGGPTGYVRGMVEAVRCHPCVRDSAPHGVARYRKHGCRCDVCREGQRVAMAAYDARRRERDPGYRTAEGGRDRSGEYAKYGYTEAQRRRDQLRRARKVEAPAEVFDSAEVYERDGWSCGICDEPVDPTLAYPDPMSASLDHVTPLSLGGSHTRDNSRCAHLRCNIRRGNRAA